MLAKLLLNAATISATSAAFPSSRSRLDCTTTVACKSHSRAGQVSSGQGGIHSHTVAVTVFNAEEAADNFHFKAMQIPCAMQSSIWVRSACAPAPAPSAAESTDTRLESRSRVSYRTAR